MGRYLNLILKSPVVLGIVEMLKGFTFLSSQSPAPARNIVKNPLSPRTNTLNCRIRLTTQQNDVSPYDVFNVEICGIITAGGMPYTVVQISVADVTDGPAAARPVQTKIKKWQMQDSPVFIYTSALGKLPGADTVLSNWTAVAQLNIDWLLFPRKGLRTLQFITSILSRDTGRELACAVCTFTYDNPQPGYIDLQENIQRAKILAVTLAFAVGAADNKLCACEIELIKKWARAGLHPFAACEKDMRKLEKALNETVAFFRRGYKIDISEICAELAQVAPPAQRYEILDFCMRVVQAGGVASRRKVAVLKNLANWLEIEPDRFRTMFEKILPADMYQVDDIELVLGINSDMDKEKTRRQLSREYRKWSARVTSSDPHVQTQADYMLNVIAEARTAFVK